MEASGSEATRPISRNWFSKSPAEHNTNSSFPSSSSSFLPIKEARTRPISKSRSSRPHLHISKILDEHNDPDLISLEALSLKMAANGEPDI
jgi:hypothetical protein